MTNIIISVILQSLSLHFVLTDIKITILSKFILDLCCIVSIHFVFLQCVLKQVTKQVAKHV